MTQYCMYKSLGNPPKSMRTKKSSGAKLQDTSSILNDMYFYMLRMNNLKGCK